MVSNYLDLLIYCEKKCKLICQSLHDGNHVAAAFNLGVLSKHVNVKLEEFDFNDKEEA